jgi:hypothetical protein
MFCAQSSISMLFILSENRRKANGHSGKSFALFGKAITLVKALLSLRGGRLAN